MATLIDTKIDVNKDYWITIEPYVFVMSNNNGMMLYNTLDTSIIHVHSHDCKSIVNEILDKENCGVAFLGKAKLMNKEIYDFISELRLKFMGDAIDVTLSSTKPVQFIPSLNLQNNISRLKKEVDISAGENIMEYLHEVTINVDNKTNNLSFASLASVIDEIEISNVGNIQLTGNIGEYSHIKDLIATINLLQVDKNFLLDYNQIGDYLFFFNNHFFIKLIITFPLNGQLWNNSWNIISNQKENVEFIFKVASEYDIELSKNIIAKYDIQFYHYLPEYNNQNDEFFRKNVFFTVEDILSSPLSVSEIFAHQTLNTFDFGKITILSNGDVYANVHYPAIGNIAIHTIHEIIYKEMNEGISWLRIRDQYPCNNCIYQWLCPSPSNYEILLDRPNLCHYSLP